MAKRAIREFDAKLMMARALTEISKGRFGLDPKLALITPTTDYAKIEATCPWLRDTKLVVKPDQLFGKRGKNKLVLADATWAEAKKWIQERMNKEVTVIQTTGTTTGTLTHFLVEPFVPHDPKHEYYLAFTTQKDHDVIYFSLQGGMDIEEVWNSVVETKIGILDNPDNCKLNLPKGLAERETIEAFIRTLYRFFCDFHFTYLELNPFVLVNGGRVIPLDCKARLDDYAAFQCTTTWTDQNYRDTWGELQFPKAFGMVSTPEEEKIEEIDSRTGASLKLTVLNPKGRIWNLVAGGGASVIYADTVCDLGLAPELANYGEYSGDPSQEDTYEYTKVVLDLMTRTKADGGKPKYLLIGGGIANFTDVASTFTGIIKAIEDYRDKLKAVNARIFVRRGGPNYETGLAKMRKLGQTLGLPIQVYGPETHMTAIVRMAAEEK